MRNHLLSKFLIIGSITAASLTTFAQEITYVIKGTVGHLNHPAKTYLMYNDASGKKIDSANIVNGDFIFKGIIDQPRGAVLYISKTGAGFESTDPVYILFYLESGIIEIKTPNTLDHAVVTGGPINLDNNELNTLLQENNEELRKVHEAYGAISPEQSNQNNIRDILDKRNQALVIARKAIYLKFIKQHPSSMMSLFALKNYERPVANISDIEPIFNMLSANIRESTAGKSYEAEIGRMKHLEVGAIAPDFTLSDPTGKITSLHDFKGKYVLVDFWASWCPPCRADNPNVVKLYSAYKDRGLVVLSVSLDNVKSSWLKAIQEDKLPWMQLSDLKGYNPGGVAKLYSLDGIPQNYLIGPDGKIINKATITADLPVKLKELLK